MKNRGAASLSQMTNRTRNLVLFLVLTGAALGTWVLGRGPDPVREASTSAAQPDRGLYMTGATLYGTDDNGHIQFQVEADRVEQEKTGAPLEFDAIRLEYAPGAEVNWYISASRGIASENLDQLQMLDDVLLILSSAANSDDLIFRSSELLIDAGGQRVETEVEVVLNRGSDEFVGEGLVVDMSTNTFSFDSEVTIVGTR